MEPWQPISLTSEQRVYTRMGPLEMWIHRRDDEIHVHWIHGPEEQAAPRLLVEQTLESAPVGAETGRWLLGEACETLQLLPVLPDRAVVVRTRDQLMVPAGRQVTFYVGIPLWLRLQTAGKTATVLGEFPSVIRSNIWFGSPIQGELCYSLISRATRSLDETDVIDTRAVCPVKVHNRSADTLHLERFCVTVRHLNLYRSSHRFWTNDVLVTFQDGSGEARIEYGRRHPAIGGKMELVTPARVPLKEQGFHRGLFVWRRLAHS